MSSNSMITVVSPYKLVAYGLARELSLRFKRKKLRLLLSHYVDHCPLYLPHEKQTAQQFTTTVSGLTKRDVSILALASYGLSDSEIAQAVETGIGAIKNRLSNIYDKMGVTSRLDALAVLQQRI